MYKLTRITLSVLIFASPVFVHANPAQTKLTASGLEQVAQLKEENAALKKKEKQSAAVKGHITGSLLGIGIASTVGYVLGRPGSEIFAIAAGQSVMCLCNLPMVKENAALKCDLEEYKDRDAALKQDKKQNTSL